MSGKLIIPGLGLLLLGISFWVKGEAFDIQLYATYYVIGWASLFKAVGLLCCLVAGVAFCIRPRVAN